MSGGALDPSEPQGADFSVYTIEPSGEPDWQQILKGSQTDPRWYGENIIRLVSILGSYDPNADKGVGGLYNDE